MMSGRRIRMVVTDLDGTLLRNDKSISPRTQCAIARLREKYDLHMTVERFVSEDIGKDTHFIRR